MTPADLDRYLRTHIPLSGPMGLSAVALDAERACIRMPLAPNHNPHGTIFGGALSALGLLTGWALLHATLERARLHAMLVGQDSRTQFLAPATADCEAEALLDASARDAFLRAFAERGRARIELDTRIRVAGRDVARHHGVYVALQEQNPA